MTVLPRAATSQELIKLRKDNQSSRLYLTIHQPATVYTARLAAVPASTDSVTSITYNVGSGTYTDILQHQTLLVGSTAGGSEYGQCRIRNTSGLGATSGTFNIGETSEVNWQSNAYLTVLDEFQLWRRDPRVEANGTIYMDYDVAYTDQHSKCHSIVVMGPPAVKWLKGATVDVKFDASQSWCVNNTITSYAWSGPGSSASSGTSTATPTFTYNATGTYRVSCVIGNSDGMFSVGYRYVFVINESSTPPALITHFNLDNFAGDYSSGGWSAQITLLDQADLTMVRDRALAILHTRDWYGLTSADEGSVGCVDDRENIALVGWIALESDRLASTDKYSTTSFTIQGPQWWLNRMTAFPAGLKDKKTTPTKWTRWLGLTARAATWHVLNWRTTAPVMMDCYPMTNQWRAARLEAPGAQTIWTQLLTILDNALIAKPCCDAYGRLFMQQEQNTLDTTTRSTIPTVMTLTRPDWTNEINFDRRQVDDVAYVDLSGVTFDGTNPTPFFSLAPGHVFRHWGSADVRERLVLYDQATTNVLCGAYFGWKNNPYPRFTFELAQHNRLIDLAPYQYLAIDIAAGDTPRSFIETGLRLIPRAIHRQWNKAGQYFTTQVECEAESAIGLSITSDVPAAPPIVPITPPPPPPPPPPPLPKPSGDAKEVWFATQSDLFWAGDYFAGGQPTWNKITPGLGTIDNFFILNDGSIAYVHAFGVGWYKGTSLKTSPSWTSIHTDSGVSTLAASCDGTNLYNVQPVSGSTWKFSTYNGTAWSYGPNFTVSWFQADCVGKDFACLWDQVFNAAGTRIEFNVMLGLYENTGWVNSNGARFAVGQKTMSSASILHTPGGSDILNYGIGAGSTVRGAMRGPHVMSVDPAGIMHYSSDGSSFTTGATWIPGFAYDARLTGGGSAIWIPRSIAASAVPTRFYNVNTWAGLDMTGNFWSLTSGTQTVVGMGLTF